VEVLVIERVCSVNEIAVEAVVGRLVTTDEEDSGSPRVEGVEDTNGRACTDPEFAHVRVTRTLHRGGVGEA